MTRSAAKPPVPGPDLSRERALGGRVAGIDEAGCAPLAGPVVAAAVVLPPDADRDPAFAGLTDSKLLAPETRRKLADAVLARAEVGIGAASSAEIDRLNIYRATMLAMRRAAAALPRPPDRALVDGNRAPALDCEVMTLVKGDQLALSVSAASVVAKVTRDRAMALLCRRHPDFGWSANAGYPTAAHMLGLLLRGPTRHHRMTFQPLAGWYGGLLGAPRYRLAERGHLTARESASVEIVPIRADLVAVVLGTHHLLGMLQNRRGWRFAALGPGEDGRAGWGRGPCAAVHERPVAAPEGAALRALLAEAG